MLLHFGTQKTPGYRNVSKDQRVRLKSIFDANGTLEDVCRVLGLPLPAAAVPYAQPAAPAPAGDDGGSANVATEAQAASSPLVQPQVAASALQSAAAVISGISNHAEVAASDLEQAQVASSALEQPQAAASEPQIAAAAVDAVSADASSGSSALVAASATGPAISNEQQGNFVAPSQAPAPAGVGGSSSPSAISGIHAPQPLASAAAAPGDSPRSAAAARDSSISGGASGAGSARSSSASKRPIRDVERVDYAPRKNGGARQNHQIDFGQGLPNPIFDQEKDCFKNSIALLMRLQHVPTSLNLQSPNMSLCDINVVLNQGGYYLRQLPLYFDENQNKFFKPEVPTLLAVFLQIQFGVDLPWLRDSSLDFSQVQKSISRVLLEKKKRNYLPFLILNPFNNNGVPLHCVGLECRWNKAIVWDPANVNSFEFSLRTLNALCDGRWTPSFRRIWCICARA